MNEIGADVSDDSEEPGAVDRARILVVDDEAGVRESLRFVLEPHFIVFTAESGEAALDALRKEPVDVVLLDLTMPGLGGVETLARIRELDEAVEVVIITGYGSYQTAVETLRLRAFDYITKPLDIDRMLAIIQRAEESHRLRLAATDRYETVTRQILELLDALSIQRRSEFSETFFVKLDFARLLAHSLRDRTGEPDSAKPFEIVQQIAREVDELEALLPQGAGDPAWRALSRARSLLRSLPVE